MTTLRCDRCGATFQRTQGLGKHRRTCGGTLIARAAVLALLDTEIALWEHHAPSLNEDHWTRLRYLAYADLLREVRGRIAQLGETNGTSPD